jgi:hypothetical protein
MDAASGFVRSSGHEWRREEEAEGVGRGGARGCRRGRVGEAELQAGDGSYPCRDMVEIGGGGPGEELG